MKTINDYIRIIPDFPEQGVVFRDISTIIQDPDGFKLAIDTLQDMIGDLDFDLIAGAESRGFVFGAPIAYNLHKPLVLIRKKGKLPGRTVSVNYSLEYGSDATLEMQEGAVAPGQKVLLVDDLLATGGTIDAMARLVLQEGGTVAAILVLMELKGLKGREFLHAYDVRAAVSYEGK
jgi:adenine phosphoribosyltransferase